MNWLHPISKDLLKIEELKNSKIHLLFELRICLRCVCEISVQMHDIFRANDAPEATLQNLFQRNKKIIKWWINLKFNLNLNHPLKAQAVKFKNVSKQCLQM